MKNSKTAYAVWLFVILFLAIVACQGTSTPQSPTATSPANGGNPPPDSSFTSGVAPVNLPNQRADQAGDPDSSVNATKKSAPGGDRFAMDLFERPFNANTMDTYFPYYDIVDTQGFKNDTWGYATITMSGTDTNGHLPGKYGVELDLNKDGRGDFLVIASAPSSTDWTKQGIQIWQDKNGDVGGQIPLAADKGSGDGYETLVFDQGKGSDPDSAWVRIDPQNPKTVILAFKLSAIGSPASYAMGAWAGADLNPAMFDYNDHMTHEQAGSPLPDLNTYPLKGLAEIDNTCRLAIGFTPNGKEPGLCQTTTPSGAPVPTPICGGKVCNYGIDPTTCLCIPG